MIKRHFRTLGRTEARAGLAIWLDGKAFDDTNPIAMKTNDDTTPVCGPFLVERVLFRPQPPNERFGPEPRVDIIDPSTGKRRSMMCSWLLVPKEKA